MPTCVSLFSGVGGFDLALERVGFDIVAQVELDEFCQRVLARRFPGSARWADVRDVGLQPAGGGAQRGLWPAGPDAPVGASGPGGGELRGPAGRHADANSPDPAGGTLDAPGRESVDLLVGGFPCQDLSVAGKRAGLKGERSGLFWEIVRIAKILRPTFGLFENVPGLISSNAGRDFWVVLEGLRECWPVVGWRILDSQHFGVAQRRRRVFLVGGPTDASVAEILALTEGGGGDLATRGEAGARVARTLTGGAPGSRSHGKPSGSDRRELVIDTYNHTMSENAHTLRDPGYGGINTPHVLAFDPTTSLDQAPNDRTAPPLKVGSGLASMPWAPAVMLAGTIKQRMRGATDEVMDNLVAAPLTASYGKQIDSSDRSGGPPNLIQTTHALTGEGHDASEDGTGRGTPLVVDTTQITSDKNYSNPKPGDPCHPLAEGAHPPLMVQPAMIRRLTPLECERLQGFPDGWTCECQPLASYADDPDGAALRCVCPDSPRYRALGNAVTVNVIEWIGRRLMEVLR